MSGDSSAALRRMLNDVRVAVAAHAQTLDDAALGRGVVHDRDTIDNAMYNVVRATDPEAWDRMVPGLRGGPSS